MKLTKEITVMTTAQEVDPPTILSWLDPTVMDDRILAAALSFQSEQPSAQVTLVTSDLNLQNKADSVGLPYIETPKTDKQLSASITVAIERRGTERHWVLVVANQGPKRANDLTFRATTSEDDAGPCIRFGPTPPEKLDRNATTEHQLTLFGSGPVYLHANWADDAGKKSNKWAFTLDAAQETVAKL